MKSHREAEQSVLGALLLDSTAIERIPALKVAHFADGLHRRIMAAVQSQAAAHKPIDPITVQAAMSGDEELLAYLQALVLAVPSARHVERYAELVREAATQREIREAADAAQAVAMGPGASKEKLDAIASLFTGIQVDTSKGPRRLGELAMERVGYYQSLEDGKTASGWATLIPGLDRMLNGGLRPGALYILAARPSVGKTSLSMQILMEQGRAGRPSLFLSQEMPSEAVVDRAVANAARINGEALLSGRMVDEDWTRAVDALHAIADLPVWLDDQPAQSLLDMRAKARVVPGLKALVVDYLQLCDSSLKRENRAAQVGEISRGLKALAKELGVAVIALSQLNREVEKRPGKRPQMSDLRDSGEIEQDADAVIFLWPLREESEHDPARRIGLDLAKNRSGRKGALVLRFEGSTQRWSESTESVEDLTAPPPSNSYGREL